HVRGSHLRPGDGFSHGISDRPILERGVGQGAAGRNCVDAVESPGGAGTAAEGCHGEAEGFSGAHDRYLVRLGKLGLALNCDSRAELEEAGREKKRKGYPITGVPAISSSMARRYSGGSPI